MQRLSITIKIKFSKLKKMEERLLKNEKTNITCYRVNEYVPFKLKWFYYILRRNLPWYYRIIPIIIEDENINLKIKKIIYELGEKFALIIFEKYINKNKAVLTIVTNKSLLEINEILNKTIYKITY